MKNVINHLNKLQVHVKSPFILNGVCVRWKGYLDMERLDGVGCIEFDEEMAAIEDAILRDTVEAYNRRIKEFEEHTKARTRQLAAFQQAAAAHHAAQQAAAAQAAAAAAGPTPSNSNRSPSQSSSLSASMSSTSTCITTASATASSAAAPQLSPSNNNNSFLANNSHSITALTSPTPPGAGGLGRISDPMLSNATGSNSPLGSTALGPSSSIHADLLEV